MLKSQSLALEHLSQVTNLLSGPESAVGQVLGQELATHLQRLSATAEQIGQQELLVPVVGSFSAGKSSLLNALMGAAVLPVAIAPETALPAELRHSEVEYILASTSDGREERHPLAALPELQSRAEQYSLLRLYLNRPALKALAPLVLVDMPGFNAPREQHNRAIEQYIGRGVHYLFVVSVQEGSLHRHALDSVREVTALGRSFSIALNKSDLLAPAEVREVAEYISGQLEAEGLVASITPAHEGDPNGIQQVLNALDAEDLMTLAIRLPLREVQSPLRTALEQALRSGRRTASENEADLQALEEELRALKSRQASQQDDARAPDLGGRATAVLDDVAGVLRSSSKALAVQYMSQPEAFQDSISQLVRSSMMRSLAEHTSDMAGALAHDFTQSSSATLRVDLQLDESWLNLALERLQTLLPALLSGDLAGHLRSIGQLARSVGVLSLAGKAAKASKVVGKWAPHPVVQVGLQILPTALEWLGQAAKGRAQDQVEASIREQLLPQILIQLRPQVDQLLTDFHRSTLTILSETLANELECRHKALEEAMRRHDITAQQQVIQGLQVAIEATERLVQD